MYADEANQMVFHFGFRAFWAGADCVVIEADAFKESDVIYRALSSRGHVDMIQTAELVRHDDQFFKKTEEPFK